MFVIIAGVFHHVIFILFQNPTEDGINFTHVAMKDLLNRYVAVGGLPAAVNKLIETGNMSKSSRKRGKGP